MFGRRQQVALPRRVTAYYLLFGLASLVWIAVGFFHISEAVHESRTAQALLTSLGRTARGLELAYLSRGTIEFQKKLEELDHQHAITGAAVVSPEGEIIAHTNVALVKTYAQEVTGEQESFGDVTGVRFEDESGRQFIEYRTPLISGEERIGTLRVTAAEDDIWNSVRAAAERAPVALFGPLLLLGAGCVLLHRMVNPVADVERQLRELAVVPSLTGWQLHEVDEHGASAHGWNRLVDNWQEGRGQDLHQRLHQALSATEKHKMEAILNSLTDGVATTDRQGAITYCNTAMAALVDRRRTEPDSPDTPESGEGDSQVPAAASDQPEHDRQLTVEGLQGDDMLTWLERSWQLPAESELTKESSLAHSVTIDAERPDVSGRRVLRITRAPLRADTAGTTSSHVWTLRDVSQLKLAEEMRNQFVDTATHELRTPLANIKAYAETLALADFDDVEEQKSFLNTINAEATRLARFVDDLLSVSSMEVGSLTITRKAVDLERLIKEVIEKVTPQMEEKQIEFATRLPEKWPTLELDKDKIAATFVNMLGNATKYTPKKGRIELTVGTKDDNLEVSVKDTGFGIAEEEISQLFNKFFRSSDPRVAEETGTGLGLSLANEIVRLHGGTIQVKSQINKGSTFTVVIPLNHKK